MIEGYPSLICIFPKIKRLNSTEAPGPAVKTRFFYLCRFEPQRVCLSPPRCLTCLLRLQGVQWIQGLVMVCVSWSGHPELKKKKKEPKCKSHMVSLRSVKKYTWIPLNLCWISIVLSSTIGPIMEIIGKWQKKGAFLTCIYLNCPSYKAAKNVFAPK
jgi:hypothetical protein